MRSLRSLASTLPLVVVSAAACSSASFTTASGDAGAAHSGDAAKRSKDGGSLDARPADGSGGAADGKGKGPKDAVAADVGPSSLILVNKAGPTCTTPDGTAACPYPTILAGLAAAGKVSGLVTVHVVGSGASGGAVYAESGVVAVTPAVTLEGDGPAETTISAAGVCGATTCAVTVSAGALVTGFTITSSGGDGVVTLAGGPPAPSLSNVTITGCAGNGILAGGGIELGPNASVVGNKANGLESPAAGTGKLHVIGRTNAFNDNSGNGIDVNGAAWLSFEGGTANGNGQGIRLAGPTVAGATHSVTALTATGNKGPGGFVAYASSSVGQPLTLRGCTLTGNTGGVGLSYVFGGGSVLDIGATAVGGNTFGGATELNAKAGLLLCNTGVAIPALGDYWAACAPVETKIAACADLASLTTYSDVVFSPAAGAAAVGGPVTVPTMGTGACQVGP